VAIKSWACDDTRRIFEGEWSRRFPRQIQARAQRKLLMLNGALVLDDLRAVPGNRLERLHRDREGQHSIRVNDQYRICFTWRAGDAFQVEMVDYH
jgi:toxin HigB-1